MKRLILILLLALLLPLAWSGASVAFSERPHWSTASTASIDIAPNPATTREAVIQVYAARLWGWRGALAVHSWIAVKPEDASSYQRFDIMRWSSPPLRQRITTEPDTRWAGNAPDLLLDRRGAEAAALIPKILASIESYPHGKDYITWPGPNSNSFIAHIGRSVPELGLELPPTAIGKDYITDGALFGRAPSGQGVQLSLFGLAGLLVAPREGLELHLLGLTLGIDPLRPALKLPGIGRIGMPAAPERGAGGAN
ncbi:DUF3750 domain-containing protein [Ferrovibrio sp.]|uniref:DUF3750 domain-containing protein n=1 Tax=Ferrovibrio sp. TaxID=1917215 RepID=UPI003D13DA9A